MSLTPYKKKRNFRATPEPDGDEAVVRPTAAPLRFCVQLHHATQKHYDFRLELDGTMKSWAVPKGPSLDPLERRLAVLVEDHPIAYCEFEGIIPAGNYGAGTVMIWDEGPYTARGGDRLAVDAEGELRRGYARGDLKVMLSGAKLKGEFALVRLKKGDGRTWLLLKKRDAYAEHGDVGRFDRSVRSGRSIAEIAATATGEGKIWLPKRTESVAVPAAAKPAPTQAKPVPGALPHWQPSAALPTGRGLLRHAVYDGYRVQLLATAGGAQIIASSGANLTKRFPDIAAAAAALPQALTFDGLIVPLDQAGLPRRKGRIGAQEAVRYAFVAYDLLHAAGVDLQPQALTKRFKLLQALHLVEPLRVAASLRAGEPLPPQATALLGRDQDGCYLVGDELPAKRRSTIVPRILASSAPALPEAAPSTQLHGSRYEVVRASAPRQALPRAPTNLGKVFWPGEGLTKGDLIAYYRAVAPLILPHLRDRPESLNRHPNGITGQSFFQKEVAGLTPGWIPTTTLASGRRGKTITYLLCQDEACLLYLANLGCIELNPWLSRVETLNNPDFIVVDLDPDGVAFDEVVKTAQVVHALFAAIEMPAYCKTSGSRGLHIFAPILPVSSYDEVRVFAERLCREVHRRLPTTTSMERLPERRRGLIYLDYLQNRIGQTMASVYSVRPRPHAPVSTPLRWSEVKKGLDPLQFTIKTVGPRFERLGDLWPAPGTATLGLPEGRDRLAAYLATPQLNQRVFKS